MKKYQSISISYVNNGYFIYFTPVEGSFEFSFSATFVQIERAKEYIEFKAGKTVAKKFDPWFNAIVEKIVATPIEKVVCHEPFTLILKK